MTDRFVATETVFVQTVLVFTDLMGEFVWGMGDVMSHIIFFWIYNGYSYVMRI